MYEIQTTNDLVKGAGHVLQVPEAEIDKKALYTLEHDKPDFLLPFTVRFIDGVCEMTYRTGNRSKMAYMSGSRSPGDYVDLWMGLLKPLVDCGDWFLKPYSFIFNYDYLYCDKDGKTPAYMYIPTLPDCSDRNALNSMVIEFARQVTVTDAVLENKLLRALQDFQPKAVLDIISAYKSSDTSQSAASTSESNLPPSGQFLPTQQQNAPYVDVPMPPPPIIPNQQSQPFDSKDDIAIDIAGGGKPKIAKEKPLKEAKPAKEKKKGGFWPFRKSEPEPSEIMGGSALSYQGEPMPEMGHPMQTPPDASHVSHFDEDEHTVIEDESSGLPKLIYKGTGDHPLRIEVKINVGEVMSIGRFDTSSGVRQSDYEFDKKTKGVSRRHAVIERTSEGYSLIDLNSTAGTYVNGQLITPSAAVRLLNGDRVSFGNLGADYVWEGR